MRKEHMAFLALVILTGFCCTSTAFGQTNEKRDGKLIIRQEKYTYKVPCVQDARTDTFVIVRDKKAGGKKKTLTEQITSKLFRPNSIIAIHYFPFDSFKITAANAEKFFNPSLRLPGNMD